MLQKDKFYNSKKAKNDSNAILNLKNQLPAVDRQIVKTT